MVLVIFNYLPLLTNSAASVPAIRAIATSKTGLVFEAALQAPTCVARRSLTNVLPHICNKGIIFVYCT
jgi:hypothetical protein